MANIAGAVYDHSSSFTDKQTYIDEFMRFRTLFLCASLNLFVRFCNTVNGDVTSSLSVLYSYLPPHPSAWDLRNTKIY